METCTKHAKISSLSATHWMIQFVAQNLIVPASTRFYVIKITYRYKVEKKW